MNILANIVKCTTYWVGVFCSCLLMLTVILFAVDIIARQMGSPLGGAEEISGYVMAIITSWGVAYGLVHLSHIRIDLLRSRFNSKAKIFLDGISLLSFCLISWLIAFKTWSVLEKTLQTSAKSNTPLETPLWIPQTIWWLGWVWLLICSTILLLCFIQSLFKQDIDSLEAIAGVRSEL